MMYSSAPAVHGASDVRNVVFGRAEDDFRFAALGHAAQFA